MRIAIQKQDIKNGITLKYFVENLYKIKTNTFEFLVVEDENLAHYNHVILTAINIELIETLLAIDIEVGLILDRNDKYKDIFNNISFSNIKKLIFIGVIGLKEEQHFIEALPLVQTVELREEETKKKLGIYRTEYFNDLENFLPDSKEFYYLNNNPKVSSPFLVLDKIKKSSVVFLQYNEVNYQIFFNNINKLYSTTSVLDQPMVDAYANDIEIKSVNYSFEKFINIVTINEFYDEYFTPLLNRFSSEPNEVINVVCFKPTYLFKDLTVRFENAGCVISDYPLKNAKSYIWMRPQELFQYINATQNIKDERISTEYRQGLIEEKNFVDAGTLKNKSIAIHHGTCFEPIYQFDSKQLAINLRSVKKVVGVCEFDECYGPSKIFANKNNFDFVPIGHDDILFNEAFINTNTKMKKVKLNIGFVGRAYGSNDKKLLEKSRLSHPKGYRKGGDILLNVALRLLYEKVDFQITILGQNWYELTEAFDKYGIDYIYHTREKNIIYEDYPSVYKTFDLLFIGARCEGGPVSAIEALSLGIPIVGTDVGVLRYLKEKSRACYLFEFDRKWHTVDYSEAVNHIKKIYESEVFYEDRVKISKEVKSYTTSNWVESLISYGKGKK